MDGKQLSTQYKEHFSDYRQWEQLSHAEEWLLFADNLGERLSIDETCLSSGEVYTFLLLSAKVFTSLYELGLTLLTRYQPFLLPLFLLLN